MDIATLIGIVGGLGLIVGAILLGGNLFAFVDAPSLVVVVGGTMAATLVMFPLKTVISSFKVAMKAFLAKDPNPQELVEQVVSLADKARKESLVALEKVEIDDPFLKKGVRLVADGSSQAQVQSILESEINFLKQRHRRGQNVFKGLGGAAPAFGMIGTLVGLVNMLQTLDEPEAIGPAMAVALLTTFYGAVMANLVFLPVARKLEERSNDEQLVLNVAMEGVLSILNGEHPHLVREKLLSFLPPASREGEG
ncbi:motility protein A [Desulfohalovibrio reitneri]|uniref:motility protein A n=1 Tax=Desulfohalovibrio reitneri TaxID=1307759 RepID=UPI0004A719E8|nr:MotA/TolQ/ExbB proton channel family protein [Desulfohalovibrio reitneri]